MRNINKDMIEFAKLSEISYGDLKVNDRRSKNSKNEKSDGFIDKFVASKEIFPKEITLGKTYEVIKHLDNPKTGFQALALKDKDGNYVISFRGTESDDKKDILADYQIGKNNINPQHKDAKKFTDDILNIIAEEKKCSIEDAKSYLTLTGHSLGGIHAQQIAATYKIKAFAFNPYGANRLVRMPKNPCPPSLLSPCDIIYAAVGSLLSVKDNDKEWAQKNIFIISHKDDLLSNEATNFTSKHIGRVIRVANEQKVGTEQAHSINNLIEVLKQYEEISRKTGLSYQQITENRENNQKIVSLQTINPNILKSSFGVRRNSHELSLSELKYERARLLSLPLTHKDRIPSLIATIEHQISELEQQNDFDIGASNTLTLNS